MAVVSPPPAAPKADSDRKAIARAAALSKAKAKAAARKAKLARARERWRERGFEDRLPPPATLATEADAKAAAALARPGTNENPTSPLLYAPLMAAAGLALISILLAALPLGALERVLAVEAHYRTEHLASFVDDHRLDIALAGVGTLLVTAVVALPAVAG